MEFQYSYLLMDLGFIAVWLALFFWRKDVRREMLFVSIPFGLFAPFVNLVHLVDWWRPLYALSFLPIEDILFGFGIGGIAAVIYEGLLKKRVRIRREEKKRHGKGSWFYGFILISGFVSFFVLYYLAGLNTFYSSSLILLFGILVTYIKRKDLIVESLASGVLMALLAIVVYSIVEFLTPGWVDAFWYFEVLPRVVIFNLPLEDVIYFFLFGAAIGPLYEFWQEGRIVNMKEI